jgi:hypothetical protein
MQHKHHRSPTPRNMGHENMSKERGKRREEKRSCGRDMHACILPSQQQQHFHQVPLGDLLGPFRFTLATLRTGREVPLFNPRSLLVLASKAGEKRVKAQMEHGLPSWSTCAAWKARVPYRRKAMASTSMRSTQGELGPGPRISGEECTVGIEMWYWRSTSSTVWGAFVSWVVEECGWVRGDVPVSGGRSSPRRLLSGA